MLEFFAWWSDLSSFAMGMVGLALIALYLYAKGMLANGVWYLLNRFVNFLTKRPPLSEAEKEKLSKERFSQMIETEEELPSETAVEDENPDDGDGKPSE